MNQNILKLFLEKGFLLDKDMLNFLNDLNDERVANEILNKIAIISQKKLITKVFVSENLDKIKSILFELDIDKGKLVDKYFTEINTQPNAESGKESVNFIENSVKKNVEQLNGRVKILSSPLIASQKLTVKDFLKHFKSRYNLMKKL